MKTILCYGDSNTHGFDPRNHGRYPKAIRWPGRMQALLGADYDIIEEGLNSRTTVLRDPCYDDNKSGLDLLPAIIKTHWPFELLILMLGSNDMKLRFHMPASNIARGIGLCIAAAQQTSAAKSADGKPCEILLVAPPHITPDLLNGPCADDFGQRALDLSAQLSEQYALTARLTGVHFFDAGAVTTPSSIDGLHLTSESHEALAQALAQECRRIFNSCPPA